MYRPERRVTDTRKVSPTLRVVIAATIVCFAMLCVFALVFTGKPADTFAYVLVGVLPSTIASIVAVKTGDANNKKIDIVAQQTNGPIAAVAKQVEEIHKTVFPDGYQQ